MEGEATGRQHEMAMTEAEAQQMQMAILELIHLHVS